MNKDRAFSIGAWIFSFVAVAWISMLFLIAYAGLMLINPVLALTLLQYQVFAFAFIYVWIFIGLRRIAGAGPDPIMRQIRSYKQAEALFIHALFWPLAR